MTQDRMQTCRRSAMTFAAAMLLASAVAGPAAASTRWEPAAIGSVAILPAPQNAKAITAATLFCSEQRWSFQFRVEPGTVPAAVTVPASIIVGGQQLAAEARESGGSLFVAIEREALDPLRVGNRMAVEIGDQGWTVAASFSLAGSRVAINAAAPLCSTVDMSAYERVTFASFGSGFEDARRLMQEEADIYTETTKREATVTAALVDRPGGKRLLFASLCGVTYYYGESGCTVSGFASETSAPDWRRVYGSEGVHLHLDPRQDIGGWPNLVTLPLVNGLEPETWIWNGQRYLYSGAEDTEIVDTVADQFE